MLKHVHAVLENHQPILQYYNSIAGIYDTDRFGNSYGQYLHEQENAFLKRVILPDDPAVLDIGCGTGRFMDFATHGIDISDEMLKRAKEKFPGKVFTHADAERLPFEDGYFDKVLCMHVLMHLPKQKMEHILGEAHRVLKQHGSFVFDVPSKSRRIFSGSNKKGWHGASSYSVAEIKKLTRQHWQLKLYSGLLFLPIHRIPAKLRKPLLFFDSWVCRSVLKEYSSYLIIVLQKK